MKLFDVWVTLLQVDKDIKKMKIGNHLSKLANSLVMFESDRFHDPFGAYVALEIFDMHCFTRRKRGFFYNFLISKSFSDSKFNTSFPLIIHLTGTKRLNRLYD